MSSGTGGAALLAPITASSPLHVTLLVGVGVPVPAPRELIDALTEATVTTASGRAGGFELRFQIPSSSSVPALLRHVGLAAGSPPPIVRVVLLATVRGAPRVLCDGIVTHVECGEGGRGSGAGSMLTVIGEDLTRLMDAVDFSGAPFAGMTIQARVAAILAKYAGLGIVPIVVPTAVVDAPNPTERIPAQQGTDLAYVRALAERAGYIFHLEPGPAPGVSTAYFGPPIKVGLPQPALTLDIDLFRNVDALSFSFQSRERTQPVVYRHDPVSKTPIPVPIPDVSLVNPPLALVPPLPTRVTPIDGSAKRSLAQAALEGLANASRSAESARGNGSLDVLRYGHVLLPSRLVGVRGAGLAWDGLWYCDRVTTRLSRDSLRQEFSLSRDGLFPTVPVV